MTDKTGIYAIENLRDRRAYVGATRLGFYHRWYAHRFLLNRGTHRLVRLQSDWTIHGEGWFKFIALQTCEIDGQLAPTEQAWIDRLTDEGFSCYNKVRTYEHPLKVRTFVAHSEVYTPRAASQLLGISTYALHRRIACGKIQAFKLGVAWRIRREEVARLLKRPEPDDRTEFQDIPYGDCP